MIHRLQNAINDKFGYRLIVNKNQFYSEDQHRPVTFYTLKKCVPDTETGRNSYKKLFETTSQIQIVLYLRDLWYELNGWELPTNNEQWNEIRKRNEEVANG